MIVVVVDICLMHWRWGLLGKEGNLDWLAWLPDYWTFFFFCLWVVSG